MTKPRILVDIDGVFADFITPCLQAIYEHTGAYYEPHQVTDWDIMKSCGIDFETAKIIYKNMERKGLCLEIPAYDGAREGVERLREFADVWAVTHPFGGEHWMHERDQWLIEKMGFVKEDILHVRSSRKFAIGGTALVEDKVSTLKEWCAEQRGVGVLFERRYNIGDSWDGYRAGNWPGIVSLLLDVLGLHAPSISLEGRIP